MATQPDAFRDFGILPQPGAPAPPQCVRCFFSGGRIIGQYIGTSLVSAVGLGFAVLLALFLPFPLNLLGCAAMLAGFAAFVFLATHNDYRWVELDGTTLRAKHLYTGRVIERSLEDVACLATMVYAIRRTETAIMEAFFGRIKGVEVRFRDRRTPLRILRADPAMTNAREAIEAIIFRMAQIREIDAEVVDWLGKPLVRYVHWKGERPQVQSGAGKALKLWLCLFVFMALVFGAVFGFTARQENRLRVLGSVPPQVVALKTLIEKGPGSNPHVTLTDFRFGGSVVESHKDSRSWSSVWIALFPTDQGEGAPGGKDIKAVLTSKTIRNDADLKQFIQQGRVSGLCEEAPGLSGGTTRTELIQANPGSALSSAWVIEEMDEPPSAAEVQGILLGSGACFALVFALAIVIFRTS
jgi:hypothetical protein